jgi:hypothetical protein
MGAGGSKLLGDVEPDAIGAAGDEGRLAVEVLRAGHGISLSALVYRA